ncbi:hypothetical protein MBLNU13_g10613t1 [Cladosporium sp. NU13]
MILDENEKTRYNVTNEMHDLTFPDEKCPSRYSTPDKPPSYEALFATTSTPSSSFSIATRSTATQLPNTSFLPCVVPQISKPFGSAYASPFTRAYPPSLQTHNITQSDFLAFIDGLNQVFISNPILQGVSAAGSIMQMFHGTPIVQSVGMGVQLGSDLASAATSYARTRAYLQACNVDLFHPTGLHAAICSTRDMMAKVGHPEERLRLAPLETADDLDRDTASVEGDQVNGKAEQRAMRPMDDPRVRRVNALKGYVALLDFNVPAVVPPDNFLAKMGAWQAQKAAAKNEEKEAKRRAKSQAKQSGGGELRGKDERKLDRKLAKLEKTLDKEGGKHKERDVRKAQRKYEREEKKIEKKLEKRVGKPEKEKGKGKNRVEDREEKQANKVRWVVITRWVSDEKDDDSSDHDSLSAEQSH